MDNISKLCKGCMKHTLVNGRCSECGFCEEQYKPLPHHLIPGTVLAGKYMLGKKMGEGGFGITYIGIDLNLNMRVAIKEYYPSGCVTRNTTVSDTLTVFDGDYYKAFKHGRDKFIEEARIIAQFNDFDGIVSVKDFFLENGTAYIVMEYLDGENLRDFLNRNGNKLPVNTVLDMIKPVIEALSQLHTANLIHRDISPDNIMITKNNKVKLIDFGAARDVSPEGQKSMSIQLKPGYAPEEQYRTHGKQGPWTDVYALCATIYRMITGQVPEEANERLIQDTMQAPSKLGVAIDANIENALMRGLSVNHNNRIQSVDVLYDTFYTGYVPEKYTINKKSTSSFDKNKMMIIALCVTALVMLAAVSGILISTFTGGVDFDEFKVTPQPTSAPTQEVIVTPVPTPTAVPRQDLYNSSYTYNRMPNIHSSWLTNDEEYGKLRSVILDFDKLCVEYMNSGDMSVFKYLRQGTKAYSQQTSYKGNHPNIHEQLNGVDVINARTDGSSYYVWVTEYRTVTENGTTKDTADHWVYRVVQNGGNYIIEDYTADPIY